MPLSRAPTRGRYSRIVGVTSCAMRSEARASMGGRRAWEEELAKVSDGVAVRPSRRTEGCNEDACYSFPAGPVAAGDGE